MENKSAINTLNEHKSKMDAKCKVFFLREMHFGICGFQYYKTVCMIRKHFIEIMYNIVIEYNIIVVVI